MVDSKDAPFVPNEKQQAALEALSKSAQDWTIADHARKQLAKENPGIEKGVISSLFSYAKNPSDLMIEASSLKIPYDIVIKTYYNAQDSVSKSIQSGGFKEEIEQAKTIASGRLESITAIHKVIKVRNELSEGEKDSLNSQLKPIIINNETVKYAVLDLANKTPGITQENINIALDFFKQRTSPFPDTDKYYTTKKEAVSDFKSELEKEVSEKIKAGDYAERISELQKTISARFIVPPKELRFAHVRDADFYLPKDIADTAVKEAKRLLSSFKETGIKPEDTDIGKAAAKIDFTGKPTEESMAAYLLAKTVSTPREMHEHKDEHHKSFIRVSISEVTDKTHKKEERNPAIVFATAQQILGDTFKLPVKDIGNTETPDGNKPYIEAITKPRNHGSTR